jgi:hypothetical protein
MWSDVTDCRSRLASLVQDRGEQGCEEEARYHGPHASEDCGRSKGCPSIEAREVNHLAAHCQRNQYEHEKGEYWEPAPQKKPEKMLD